MALCERPVESLAALRSQSGSGCGVPSPRGSTCRVGQAAGPSFGAGPGLPGNPSSVHESGRHAWPECPVRGQRQPRAPGLTGGASCSRRVQASASSCSSRERGFGEFFPFHFSVFIFTLSASLIFVSLLCFQSHFHMGRNSRAVRKRVWAQHSTVRDSGRKEASVAGGRCCLPAATAVPTALCRPFLLTRAACVHSVEMAVALTSGDCLGNGILSYVAFGWLVTLLGLGTLVYF